MFRSNALKNSVRPVVMLGLLVGLILGLVSSVYAAHESNNKAELSGDGISGHAIVNYVAGTEGWSSTARVDGLAPGDYTFAVNLNGTNQTTVCSFTADGNGSDGCSDQDADLPGFNTAVIVDSDGMVVASGTFARRGGNRAQ